MRFTPRVADPLFDSAEEAARGSGLSLLEWSLSPHRGSVQVRVTVCKAGPSGAGGAVGVEDCSRLHRALLPRLELAFPGRELYLEVSSPGIDRVIKDGSEFPRHIGRGVSCYRADTSAWTGGVLVAADERSLTLRGPGGEGDLRLELECIAKAKLDYSWEV
jgi:ribosome maturation factor RimP